MTTATIEELVPLILRRLAENSAQRFFSPKEAATYLGVSLDTVKRMLRAGKIPHTKPTPGRVLIDRADLDMLALLKRKEVCA